MLSKGVSKYHKTTLLQQYSNVKFCPLSKNGTGEFYGKYFFWEFDAKPTELSKTYKVLIIFHIDNYSPDVFVLNKDIWEVSKSKSIPHLYDHKKIRLCLYYPSYNEWNTNMPLCNTIVSWTYLWLYFYEEWLYSNKWKGGGIHPESSKEEENENIKNTPKQLIIEQRKKKKQDSVKNIINKIYLKRKSIYMQELQNNEVVE